MLHPKNGGKKDVFGKVHRIRERKIIIEIFDSSFRLIKYAHRNELYDIEFLLNRQPYKLQHYALDFIRKDNLFTKLIGNSLYNCELPTLTNEPNDKQKHGFQYVFYLINRFTHMKLIVFKIL